MAFYSKKTTLAGGFGKCMISPRLFYPASVIAF
jgi:hypothetical protein